MKFELFENGPHGLAHGFKADLSDMQKWVPTIQQVRDAILAYHVAGPGVEFDPTMPADAQRMAPRQREVETIADLAREAVIAGRMIDFGHIPNAIIQEGGRRGGALYDMGALAQPFRDPWMLFHTWESGDDGRKAATYLVNPQSDEQAGADCEVCELEPVHVSSNNARALMIGDRGLLTPGGEDVMRSGQYRARMAPSVWRYVPEIAAYINAGKSPEEAAVGNVFDPLMTALLMLSTTGVERRTIRPPDKLARARAKSGKPPIPPYDVVNSEPYITALMMRRRLGTRGEDKGGTHASPVPHLRRGHIRTYATGKRTFIRDTLVGVTEESREAFLSRSHYAVRP